MQPIENIQGQYTAKDAKEFFDILVEAVAAAGEGDIRRCYHLLNIALHRAVEQKLLGSKIHYGGLFAKTDYLAKEYSVDRSVVNHINELRHRLKDINSLSDDTLREEWQEDVEALTLFIYKVYRPSTPSEGMSEIPQELKNVFPKRHRHKERRQLISEKLRMVVDRWDETTIYGRCEDMGDVAVAISEGWEYVTKLLSEGCLLNLIKPRTSPSSPSPLQLAGFDKAQRLKEGGGACPRIIPELIIYQPDYLVDISSIASCFESYADTPYVALLNRLKTVYPTKAIHLGNLASQFLDETIHKASPPALPHREGAANALTDDSQEYIKSITKFFHNNALQMAAATDIDASFHTQAQEQRENIRIAVHEALEKEVGHFDATQALLEPSFFCEALGLQGRMDLLQKDFRVLIEQKSGKGGWAPALGSAGEGASPDVPVYLEKHYVQMLLYMALLHYGYKRDGQAIENSDIQSFLLYSKYKKGLVRLGPAPELLHKAIMIRNQIAWCEISYARGEGNVLLRMKPEQLRRKQMSDRFWMQWIRPQIADVLSPIQNATPLEQKYFLRMLRFVATEHLMSKMGTNTKENSGFASKWHDSLDDKMMAGNIICNLNTPQAPREGGCMSQQQGIEKITLIQEPKKVTSNIPPDGGLGGASLNFRHGDIVVLYPYESNHDPDIRQTIVHRGTIEDITTEEGALKVTILLRSPQTTPSIFKTSPLTGGLGGLRYWAIEHDFYESSATSLYRSLHQFLSAPAHRKSLILTKREPRRNTSLKLKGDYGKFNPLVLGALQAQDIFLVIGPPGTGKTSFGLMNILKEHLAQQTSPLARSKDALPSVQRTGGLGGILLMSYTNRAVDEICSKLCEPDDGGEPYDFIRIGSELSCEPKYRKYLLSERSKECKNIGQVRSLIDRTRIFVGTTTALTGASASLFTLKSFDLAIIDEASQILEPQLLGLLSATNGIDVAIRKFVLIGDQKQLPAVVQQSAEDSKVDDPDLNAIGLTNCRNSLFERLLNRYSGNENEDESCGRSSCVFMLRNQGRMHPDIAEFPNEAFYDGQLGIVPLPHQTEASTDNRITFIAVPKPEHSASDKVNENEAILTAKLVFEAYEKAGEDFDSLKTVGVIVPYRNQISAVRRAIDSYGIPALHDITIDTVERYQGSQRELIIYSFTVQHKYQLTFLSANTFVDPITGALIDRKLNVALTRARRHEVIMGNPEILKHNPVFRNLMEYCKQHNCYQS